MASQNLKAPLKAADETLAYISLELLSCPLKSNYFPLPSETLYIQGTQLENVGRTEEFLWDEELLTVHRV
jgi:hypothetical protein